VFIYFCLLFVSGTTAIRLTVAHDGAWWWLKALAGTVIFVLLVALGAWLTRSFLAVTWRRSNFSRNPISACRIQKFSSRG
jgi:hypothetical protein